MEHADAFDRAKMLEAGLRGFGLDDSQVAQVLDTVTNMLLKAWDDGQAWEPPRAAPLDFETVRQAFATAQRRPK